MSEYQLKKVFYKELHLINNLTIDKDTLSRNINLNYTHTSVEDILLFFTDNTSFTKSNITSIYVDIDGVPNSVYATGIPSQEFYKNAKSLFAPMSDAHMMTPIIYYNAPAIYINTTSYDNNDHAGIGKKVENHMNVKINRTATTSDLTYVYIIKSSQLIIQNNKYLSSRR